jgi:mannose-6-phosphate isomerase-like protein (cupin superfamily)
MARYRWSLDEVAGALDGEEQRIYVEPFQHGTLRLGLYAPRGHDPQHPHDQDEVYVVMRGSGWFVNGDERHEFGPGDALFVPAGVEHRFEDFSDDLAIWVVFYGAVGGEEND